MGLDFATEALHRSPHKLPANNYPGNPKVVFAAVEAFPNGLHIRRQATATDIRKQANTDFAISRLYWRTGHPVRLSGVEVDYENDTYPGLDR